MNRRWPKPCGTTPAGNAVSVAAGNRWPARTRTQHAEIAGHHRTDTAADRARRSVPARTDRVCPGGRRLLPRRRLGMVRVDRPPDAAIAGAVGRLAGVPDGAGGMGPAV